MLKSKKIVDWLYNYSLYFIIGALLLVIIAIEPSFVRVSNFTTIIENVEAKQNLFAQLDAVLPVEVPICSNTSGLRITDISAKCVHPERTVTTHFWLPAHLVPLVEVVMGDKTDEAVAVAVRDELRKWKKAPVLVKRDLPGQLANRVFQAIIRESIDIVASGLASAEDVDTAISCGICVGGKLRQRRGHDLPPRCAG